MTSSPAGGGLRASSQAARRRSRRVGPWTFVGRLSRGVQLLRRAVDDDAGRAFLGAPSRWELLAALALALVLLAAGLPFLSEPSGSGLDPAYRLALNRVFRDGLEIGRDIIFTYGPLGFLSFPQPIGHNLLVGNLLLALIALLACLAFSRLVLAGLRGCGRRELVATLVLAIPAGNLLLHLETGYLLFASTLCAMLVAERERRSDPLVLAFLAPAVAFLIKPAFWVLSFSLVLGHLMIRSLRERRFSPLLACLCCSALALIAVWLAAGGSLPGLGASIVATWQLAHGNSSAMAIDIVIPSAPVLAMTAIVAAAWLAAGLRAVGLLALVAPLVAWLKYAFGRADHAAHFYELTFLLVLLLAAHAAGRRRCLAGLLLLLGGVAVSSGLDKLPSVESRRVAAADFFGRALDLRGHRSLTRLLSSDRVRQSLGGQSRAALRAAELPASLVQSVGTAGVDVYPWNVGLVEANGLRWQPRPVFQSYLAYTPWLDARNAAHLAGPGGAPFMVWETGRAGGALASIDTRYLLNDEPQTMLEIVWHYEICQLSDRAALLRRRARGGPVPSPIIRGLRREEWLRWLPVPVVPRGSLLRARLELERTVYGHARRAFYKESEVQLQYRLRGGRVLSHRIVPDNARSGLWISPYLLDEHFRPDKPGRESPAEGRACPISRPWSAGAPVEAIKLARRTPRAFRSTFVIVWEEIALE